jgi:transcriptional regulator with XRE-family HTH domain
MDASSVGEVLRAVRHHLGLTQRAVAARAGVSQSVYSRAERDRLTGLTVGTLERIAGSMGATISIAIDYRGGLADRLVDAAHSTLVEFVVGFLRSHGWQVELEFSFNVFGDRGAVDVLAWHDATRTLLIVEVKSRFTDLQALLISMSRKLRVVPNAVRDELGWDAATIGRLVVAYGTAENRSIIDRHAAIFDTSFPSRATEIRRWLRTPDGVLSGVWLVSADVVAFPERRRR